ncbi:hypothetical protein D1BOALGB6SA_3605 [Olavius sp. associated proteobacterium Delta 1]|nr:hypothetical protein D1BOALGB6SA_3605 [Olavius sp. associated proteobacterium Delta 1]
MSIILKSFLSPSQWDQAEFNLMESYRTGCSFIKDLSQNRTDFRAYNDFFLRQKGMFNPHPKTRHKTQGDKAGINFRLAICKDALLS